MQSSSSLSSHIRKPSPNIVVPIHDNNNNNVSLLDKYEIERILKELNRYIETTGASQKIGHDVQIITIKRSKGWLWFKYGMMISRFSGNPRSLEKHAPAGNGGYNRFSYVD
ncbi:hypothetical protein R3W88_011229 [Solanum pinnatisectum]|uniref:Uncharacterized protein n=1 Tax=Solanum pinnatisectum TaxID=50273 RepID=A0AAV9L5Q2_9SOLN|nr:hypothetical protein R3W88_011229 [Solanum pinnatisectum]